MSLLFDILHIHKMNNIIGRSVKVYPMKNYDDSPSKLQELILSLPGTFANNNMTVY